jgi:hypothetical protein
VFLYIDHQKALDGRSLTSHEANASDHGPLLDARKVGDAFTGKKVHARKVGVLRGKASWRLFPG